METLSATTWSVLSRAEPAATLIAYGGKNDLKLVLWFVRALLRVTARVLLRKDSVVVLGDAVTYAALAPLLLLTRTRHVTMVMGLDLTYQHPVYRKTVIPLLRKANRVLAISEATAEVARSVGIPADRVGVFQLGVAVDADPLPHDTARAFVLTRWQLPADALLVTTLGRLVRRKGARWFAAEVMPLLSDDVHYLLAGSGPDEDEIRALGDDRVHLLGRISDDEREQLLHGADLFVQPNIEVPGDMEGFGLVTIEAALRGLPVAAADLEGIKDAVVPGETGWLLPTGDAATWATAVTSELTDLPALERKGRAFQLRARELYSDEAMGASLLPSLLPSLRP
jgi:phosphatidylinositol alpha-1,6-mannosyltransferase